MRTLCVAAFLFVLCSCSKSIGGLSANYPAKDYDPVLSERAQLVIPLLRSIERFRAQHGYLPASISQLNINPREGVSYFPEKDSYILMIKLGWDPSLNYHSKDKSWEFDPGDGSDSKVIKIQTEQNAAANP